jgi:hypothetical protein
MSAAAFGKKNCKNWNDGFGQGRTDCGQNAPDNALMQIECLPEQLDGIDKNKATYQNNPQAQKNQDDIGNHGESTNSPFARFFQAYGKVLVRTGRTAGGLKKYT